MSKIDKRTLPKKQSVIKRISETKKENGRKEIVDKIKKNDNKQSDNKLAICSHRKLNHMSFQEYQHLVSKGNSVQDIIKTTSKHLIHFYNAILKGKITLSKEKFEKMYDNGMSLNEISQSEGISRDHMTHLREFYGIKRKGATFQKRLNNEKPLSQEAKDIIIGSMLGDGHITKWGYFSEKHSPKQLEYLKWKASFFPHITTDKSWSYYESIDKRSGSLIKTHGFRTTTHSWIQEMEKLWYKTIDGKRIKVIPNEIADWMNETILAVWFMDDGKTDWHYRQGIKKGNPISTMCTDSFKIKEVELLQNLLLKKFNLNSTRNLYRNRINFTTVSTMDLHNIVSKLIHETIQYKSDEKEYLKTKQSN